MDCANRDHNARKCTCTYAGCPRHGVCCECVSYHRASGEIPGCFFTPAQERTYDRSAAAFARGHR